MFVRAVLGDGVVGRAVRPQRLAARPPRQYVSLVVRSWAARMPSRRTVALSSAIALAGVFVTTPGHGSSRLFLLWAPAVAVCAPKVTRFFTCVLARPDFDALVRAYPKSESLIVESGVVIDALCAYDDFQCLLDSAGISPRDGDMVVHYYAAAPRGGRNDVAQVSVRGALVSIRIAWIATDTDCDYQTVSGGHEVYEGITEPSSVDCCDGQQPPTCAQCQPSCTDFRAHSSYALVCGGEAFRMPYVGSVAQEFDAAGCTAIAGSGPGSRNLRERCDAKSDCADGLACALWSSTGGPPFASACCRDIGGECNTDVDCCGASRCDAMAHVCRCVVAGHFCVDSAECCDGAACDPSTYLCAEPARFGAGGGCGLAPGDASAPIWALGVPGGIAVVGRRLRKRDRARRHGRVAL